MDENDFEEIAEQTLQSIYESIEDADEDCTVDIDFHQGVLSITLSDDQEILLNKHLPSQQIWLSSPHSGSTHFSYIEEDEEWCDSVNNTIEDVIVDELEELAGLEVKFL